MDKLLKRVEREVKDGKKKAAVKDLEKGIRKDKKQDKKLKKAGIKPE